MTYPLKPIITFSQPLESKLFLHILQDLIWPVYLHSGLFDHSFLLFNMHSSHWSFSILSQLREFHHGGSKALRCSLLSISHSITKLKKKNKKKTSSFSRNVISLEIISMTIPYNTQLFPKHHVTLYYNDIPYCLKHY